MCKVTLLKLLIQTNKSLKLGLVSNMPTIKLRPFFLPLLSYNLSRVFLYELTYLISVILLCQIFKVKFYINMTPQLFMLTVCLCVYNTNVTCKNILQKILIIAW